ncbi:MAG: hypothetical protein Q7S84_01255 [bacterium]|nr:hypothetical protein [bacterium]
MSKERHLIIGAGEVGQALAIVLSRAFPVSLRDAEVGLKGRFDVMHIAYPMAKNFVRATKRYIALYRPSLVIVHSTVPVGTTMKIGRRAVHSPIRGMHTKRHHPGVTNASPHVVVGNPRHFARSLFAFPKYFAGPKAKRAADVFARVGFKTVTFRKPETTELAKLLDTAYYGWNIVFAKEAKRLCAQWELDYDEVYTVPNKDYNVGYRKLGKPYVARPVLKHMPGGIGGHCVVSNCHHMRSWLTDTIAQRDRVYRRELKRTKR